MALQFDLSGSQIDGARDYQEDAFLITHLTDSDGNPSALIIVADGMGGHAAGNVASNMAVQAFNKHVTGNYPSENPADILHECVIKANSSIKETVKETPALSGMGCTLVAAILEQGKLWWASVGDSHLYLLRDKELIKKNADHSYGGFLDRMEAEGTPVEPEPGLARNMLMSAITGDEIDDIDISYEPAEIKPGDRIIICSDGMDTLSQGKIIQFGDWSETSKEYAEALLDAVEDAGMPKQDNTTVVIADVKEKAEATPAAAPEPEIPATETTKETTAAVEEAGDTTQDLATPEDTKGGKGMIIAIAAVVVIGIAVAAFVMTGGDKPSPGTLDEQALAPDTSPAQDDTVDEIETAAAGTDAVDEGEPDKESAPADEQSASASASGEIADKPARETAADDAGKREFRDTLKDGTPGPTMVWIPEGSYEMGSPGTSRNADERPRHEVNVDRFAMSKHEITFSQYDKFARATGREIPDNLYMDRETHPVIFVSWDDAYYYTKWLTEQTGKTYRLPSEAEWEYAAGTGKRSPFWWGYDEEPGRAHCFGCESGLDPRKPTKVGSFGPNPFGLHDTTGNVAEWVHDCWHETYNNAPTDGSVWEGGDCSYRVVRGGSYSSPPQSIRHAKRDKFKSDSRYDHIGIRVVREP
ncbi:MAG: SUMF1/EgtB/PvdO family nonheme iron enzyme [Gammaproteobacteria bacterium]